MVVTTPNPIHGTSAPHSSWSTVNLSEAVPGPVTPLGWSVWSPAGELGGRAPFYAMGAIPKAMLAPPARPEDQILNVFYGRVALRVDFMCEMGDLVPGTSGEALGNQVFGFVPDSFVSRPSKRRYPIIAVKFPPTFVRVPSLIRRARAETEPWWAAEVARTPSLDLAGARAQLQAGIDRFTRNLSLQATAIACAIQVVYDQLSLLTTKAGVDQGALMSGHGSHEETAIIDDLWEVSRDRLSLEEFVARHGYHGPFEGELSGVSWREDQTPLRKMVEGYRSMDDDASPAAVEAARSVARREAETQLLAALPRAGQAQARLVLKLAGHYLPLRGVGKVAFLQSLDVARAAARRIGVLLAADGVLAEPEDVFYLTAPEILGSPPANARDLVAERRATREGYRRLRLPTFWKGEPVYEVVEDSAAGEGAGGSAGAAGTLSGVGVSAGVVEGPARVVTDPALADMEPGDILVAHTTDPSWASLMFMAKALVVDIGGQLSHAAVVARELGIPCVMNTVEGTRVLRDGDRLRVDGAAGTVEILERAGG
ncbi:MAG TPA: PEP-utilizing enzyme [Acidimicrobiia bacterium]|nr:PEP-utilizing enzyme [Acidimicrobiia bacterium]